VLVVAMVTSAGDDDGGGDANCALGLSGSNGKLLKPGIQLVAFYCTHRG